MKSLIFTTLLGLSTASPILENRQNPNGPFGIIAPTTDPSLPNHSVYIPSTTTTTTKFPIVVWGNGGCGGDGASNRAFLSWLAGHGYLAIASGRPGGSGSTTAQQMTQAIDFAVRVAGSAGTRYANVDGTKVFASGFSCGGVEAMAQSWDARVSTVGVISSGLLSNYSAAGTFRKPVLFAIGGSGDVAYQNAERDFRALPADTAAWKGNLNLGHGGDLFSTNGGKFGKVQLHWLEWLFKGNNESAKYFTEGYRADGWQVQSKNIDKLKPFV